MVPGRVLRCCAGFEVPGGMLARMWALSLETRGEAELEAGPGANDAKGWVAGVVRPRVACAWDDGCGWWVGSADLPPGKGCRVTAR